MLDFEKWIGHEKSMFLSWGVEDIRVIRNDNKKNGLRLEIVNYMRKHFIDFQKEFCSYYLNSKQLISIGNVLAIFDLDFEGRKHNALDDAFNLYRIYKYYKGRC